MTNAQLKSLKLRLSDLKDLKATVEELIEELRSLEEDLSDDIEYARDLLTEVNGGTPLAEVEFDRHAFDVKLEDMEVFEEKCNELVGELNCR